MELVRLQSQKVLERWAIDAQDVELGEVLGQGAFSVVRAGTWQDGNSKVEVAVKQIPLLDKDITTEQWQRLLQEAVVMAKASERCRFACRLYGTCFLPGYFCLVMKRYVTSLDKELRKYPDRKAPQANVNQWMLDICRGVVEMHNQNIILRDLKPANILLDEYGGAILADFGIARIVETTFAPLHTTTKAGTIAYMAPEMFDTELGPVTKKSDVWALGCLLLELQTGKVPWEGDSPVQIMKKVCVKEIPPTIPPELGAGFMDLFNKCFYFESIQRASAMDVLEAIEKQVGLSSVITQNTFYNRQPSSIPSLSSISSTSKTNHLEEQKSLSNSISSSSMSSSKYRSLLQQQASSRSSTSSIAKLNILDFSERGESSMTTTETSHAKDFNIEGLNYPVQVTVLKEDKSCSLFGINIAVANDGTLYVLCRDKMSKMKLLMYFDNKLAGELSWPKSMGVSKCHMYDPFKFLASGPNDTLYSGATTPEVEDPMDSLIFMWKGKKFFHLHQGRTRKCYGQLVASPSTGTLYCGCTDGTIEVWDANLNFVTEFKGREKSVPVLALDQRTETLYSVYMSAQVKVWRNNTLVAILDQKDIATSLICTSDGTLYVGHLFGDKINVWRDLKLVNTLTRGVPTGVINYNGIRSMALHGEVLFCSDDVCGYISTHVSAYDHSLGHMLQKIGMVKILKPEKNLQRPNRKYDVQLVANDDTLYSAVNDEYVQVWKLVN